MNVWFRGKTKFPRIPRIPRNRPTGLSKGQFHANIFSLYIEMQSFNLCRIVSLNNKLRNT